MHKLMHSTVRRLTLDPELLSARVDDGGLEADTEGGQDEHSDEEDLAGVAVEEAAELEELGLETCAEP